ncbi:MAG: PQQ-binding-like beta-propeller repeat protein [Pseudomonadales bacterium]
MHLAVVTALVFLVASLVSTVQAEILDRDWPVYLGDAGRQHYSPLTQIDKANVNGLQVAWRYSAEPEVDSGTMYTSPLVVDGVLYGLSPSLVPFALNAATGEELWRHDLGLPRNAQRGLMWWPAKKRIYFTAGKQLVALDAASGQLVPTFGDGGMLDTTPTDADPNRRFSQISVTVPGVVFADLIILGFSTTEDRYAYPGSIRAFHADTGKLVWQFNTLPRPGELGSHTWEEGSQAVSGGANVWTGMALDEARGLLFAPTGSATPDFYGGNRIGDNLFANSIVALDARTGEYRWHHQVVKHDLWDKDNPSPPTLVQFQRDGKTIDAVTLTTKTGHLYAFERETGELLYPLIEVDTSIPSTLPGERPAPKQYVSSVEISRQQFEITQRTPAAQAYVQDLIKDWDQRPWAPPRIGTVLFYPWYDGGAEWGGSAYEPATDRLIVNSNDQAAILTLGEIPVGTSDFGLYTEHCASCHGADRAGTERGPDLNGILQRKSFSEVAATLTNGASGMPAFAHLSAPERSAIYRYVLAAELPEPDAATTAVGYALTSGYVYLKDHEGLPGSAPPWGTLNSIDLSSGDIVWKVNLGNFPSHPELNYGALSYGGPVVTASGLIFIAATPDRMLRAFDSANGDILWQTELPAAGFSTPAIYAVNGRQYVVIAAGGGRLGPPSGSDYIAYALPAKTDNKQTDKI